MYNCGQRKSKQQQNTQHVKVGSLTIGQEQKAQTAVGTGSPKLNHRNQKKRSLVL